MGFFKNLFSKNTNESKPVVQPEQKPAEKSIPVPYGSYDDVIKAVNPCTIDYSDAEVRTEYNSTEKCYLRAISKCRVENPAIARLWYSTYGMEYEKYLKIFFKNELLYINEEKFALTDEGKALIEGLPYSATYNFELEDECIKLILEENYDAAYKKVCEFRSSAPYNAGLVFDWNKATEEGWTKKKLKDFSYSDDVLLNACTIFCEMMGLNPSDALKIINRKGQK